MSKAGKTSTTDFGFTHDGHHFQIKRADGSSETESGLQVTMDGKPFATLPIEIDETRDHLVGKIVREYRGRSKKG